MNEKKPVSMINYLVLITFVLMVAVNALAVTLPLNGEETGAISDSYPNLFAPAGIAFSIWGVIYLLLAGFSIYQFKSLPRKSIAVYFSVSSVVNAAWIFSWHYRQIPVSMVLMLIILICLIRINQINSKLQLTIPGKLLIKVPFSVYFGWITVATIANATTLLVSLKPGTYGLSEPAWTVIILIIGALIGLAVILGKRLFAYGLVLIWAYSGILLKHISDPGFNYKYPGIVFTVIACLFAFLVAEGYLLISSRVKNGLPMK